MFSTVAKSDYCSLWGSERNGPVASSYPVNGRIEFGLEVNFQHGSIRSGTGHRAEERDRIASARQ